MINNKYTDTDGIEYTVVEAYIDTPYSKLIFNSTHQLWYSVKMRNNVTGIEKWIHLPSNEFKRKVLLELENKNEDRYRDKFIEKDN